MPDTVFFRDKVAGKFRQCAGGCGAWVLPPKRKCPKCKVRRKKYTVVEGRPIERGRNATGTCLHKPDKVRTKRTKRQHLPSGRPVEVRMMRMDLAKVRGTRKDQENNK